MPAEGSLPPGRKLRPRKPATRTPRAPLTLEGVAAAAFQVIEREGLDSLTMRKLADELGVQAASLYWHVKDKLDLIDLLAEALFAGFAPEEWAEVAPDGGEADWQSHLSRFAHGFRRYLLSRRDAARILTSKFVVGPSMLRHLDEQLGRIRAAGMDDRCAAYGFYNTLVFVHGSVLWETSPLSAAVARGVEPRQYLGELRAELDDLDPGTYPHAHALADELTRPGMDERFAFGLKCLLAGLAQQLNQP
ncbi:TetR/AcrR family transcriptional regulator C-terminal domain-containing protein [Streptomyces sp. NBC_01207]|uniref:TetR/AcrR family transcriptional regulator C-terminal domain-containing protein n=1 Tax=Streptomyces sp. NBC_01207 TaxID=2903772 RepID=UPI002E10564D|nr:TetR/AcrR family transcriptional regulator C-terminal domain-containing protein [Streptomyces sp. NBC_01207]